MSIEQSVIFEPNDGDSVEANLDPIGRAYYAFSTLLSTPAGIVDRPATPALLLDLGTCPSLRRFRAGRPLR